MIEIDMEVELIISGPFLAKYRFILEVYSSCELGLHA